MKINDINYVSAINPDKPKDRFQKGKRFKARVKNITPDSVELVVEEGIITARMTKNMGAHIGDIAEFEVIERTEDRMELKHIKQDKIDEKFDMRI